MITKDVAAMITYSLSYADEIGRKKNGTYPQDAELTLRDQFKDDLLVFLGYIYDPQSSDDFAQLDFINSSLQIVITRENFLRLRNDKSLRPDILDRVPLSLQYFVKDDLSPFTRRAGYGIALSKYLVNTFNDVGCYFAAFNGISDYEADRIAEYIGMMNAFLDSAGLLEMTPAQVRASMGIVDKPDRRPREYGADQNRGRSYFAGRADFMFGQRGRNTLGNILWGRSYNSNRDNMNTYSSAQADMDAMIMMNNYNMQHAEAGTGFDEGMLRSAPSGRVDRSMSIEETSESRGVAVHHDEPKNETSDKSANRTVNDTEELDALLQELNSLIGLSSVKKSLNNLINLVKIRKLREEMGLKTPDMSLHLVFSGNPGTGKTTVARLLAEIYHQLGVVSKGQFIEVDRAGLVEGYVGQTAQKTSKVCDEAMGGILFIDEAYTLTKTDGQDFGQEAVDTLLKRMEDNRSDFIVIVAGYTEEMKDFIDSNPGLKSRFNKFIEFPDYTGNEMYKIFELMCCSQDYVLTGEASEYVKSHLNEMTLMDEENFANAREVRNYFERCVERQASRIVSSDMIDANKLTTLCIEDVKE
ncbi:ATPase family associated with various cellular activities (AAA) [Lachnospiraceae bacterium]|nr:ATPase family associated with various cellular activities (AAA) [Lachnospiraceae bacterium]